jgi:serine/arginine repetitive matrix protein 2
MKALLEHSVQNYGPLPSDLRPRRIRSRTQSRASPYPQPRLIKTSLSSADAQVALAELDGSRSFSAAALQPIPMNPNIEDSASVPSLEALKSFSPLALNLSAEAKSLFGPSAGARPRVPSNARRSALGWSKRSTGKSKTSDAKENVGVGQGLMMT